MQFDVNKNIIYRIMKRTFKALLISMFAAISLLAFDIHAQEKSHSNFEGTWVLDSVQVKEIMPDGIKEKTVLPDDDYEFDNIWMQQFTLNADGMASYKDKIGCIMADIPYLIDNKIDNETTLTIEGIDYKVLSVRLLSNKTMLITHSLTSGDDTQVINIFWKIYYHKSN